MSSASTKRRHKRKADAFMPWDARAARAENEAQRLRAAMAHAMIDCQWIVTLPDARADVRRRAHRALTALKTALEKK